MDVNLNKEINTLQSDIQLGDFENALKKLHVLLDKHFDNPNLHLLYSQLLLKKRDYGSLEKILFDSIKQFPRNVDILKRASHYFFIISCNFQSLQVCVHFKKVSDVADIQIYMLHIQNTLILKNWEQAEALIKEFQLLYPAHLQGELLNLRSQILQKRNIPQLINSIEVDDIENTGMPPESIYFLLINTRNYYRLKSFCKNQYLENPSALSWIFRYLQVLFHLNEEYPKQRDLFNKLLTAEKRNNNLMAHAIDKTDYRFKQIFLDTYLDHGFTKVDMAEILYFDNHIRGNQPIPSKSSKVDIVYSWVDMNDPSFAARFEEANGFNPNTSTDQQHNNLRYTNSREIELSLLSVQRFFDDVNKIYIVVNQQTFDLSFLLPDFRKKVIFIEQEDIIDKEYAAHGPYFNSTIIESFLWRIPNLTENFIYLNDDNFLANRLIIDQHIFNESGVLYANLIRESTQKYEYAKHYLKGNSEAIFNQSYFRNSRFYFIKHFHKEPNLKHNHQAYILNKSACKHVYDLCKEDWKENYYKNRIRSNDCLHTTQLYIWAGVELGYQTVMDSTFLNRASLMIDLGITKENLQFILEKKPLYCCINSVLIEGSVGRLNYLINHFKKYE